MQRISSDSSRSFLLGARVQPAPGADYASSHSIAGSLQEPQTAVQPVAFRDVLSPAQKWVLRGLVVFNLVAILLFLGWLVTPAHIPELPRTYRDIHLAAGIGAFAILLILEIFRLSQSLILILFASRMKDPIPLVPQSGLRVAVLTTIVPSKEPVDLVTRTLAAMRRLRYDGQVDVWILDEGDDPEVRRIARQLGVHHFSRKGRPEYNQTSGEFRAKSKAGNHNAWRAENEHRYDIVAQMDPDHVPLPAFLERTIGYFRDPDVAFVVAPQVYGNLDESFIATGAADQSYLFHGVIQRGGNGLGAPLLIGTNHLYRVTALEQIGGYQDSVIEDHLTSLTLHTTENPQTGNCWRGIYTPDILAVGEGPAGWTDYFNQQQRWAYGIWDIVLTISRRMLPKLSWSQRLAYIGLESFYPSVAIIWLLGGTLTSLYLLFGVTAIQLDLDAWLQFWLPTVLSQFTLFFWLRRFNLVPHERKLKGALSGLALSLAAGPVYVVAAISSWLRRPLVYVVTAKSSLASPDSIRTFRYHLVWAAGSAFALATGFILGHTHVPLQAWALFTIAAVLFPIMVFSLMRFREGMKYSYSSPVVVARFSAVALPLVVVLAMVVGTAANWQVAPEPDSDLDANHVQAKSVAVEGLGNAVNQTSPGSAVVGDEVGKPAGTSNNSSLMPDPAPSVPEDGNDVLVDPSGTSSEPELSKEPVLTRTIQYPGFDRQSIMFGAFKEDSIDNIGDLSHVYYQFSEPAGSFAGFAEYSSGNGQLAVISWEPRLSPILAVPDPMDLEMLDRIAEGEFDGYIRSVATALGGTRTPVIVRFAFEMDLEANGLHPWGGRDPQVFVKAHRRVVDLFLEEGADNVRWLWSPSAMTDEDGRLTSLDYYPGAEYVDYTGFSAFLYWRWEEWSEERSMDHAYRTPSEYMTQPIQDLSSFGHPIIIPELGVDLHPSRPEYEKGRWLQQLALELAEGRFPQVVGIIYFDSKHNWDEGDADWRLTLPEREAWFGALSDRQAAPADVMK